MLDFIDKYYATTHGIPMLTLFHKSCRVVKCALSVLGKLSLKHNRNVFSLGVENSCDSYCYWEIPQVAQYSRECYMFRYVTVWHTHIHIFPLKRITENLDEHILFNLRQTSHALISSNKSKTTTKAIAYGSYLAENNGCCMVALIMLATNAWVVKYTMQM